VIAYEAVWNDGPGSATGGGVSRFFPLPVWQQAVGVPPSVNPDHHTGRGVPDVSGVADPQTGIAIITLDGQHIAVIGGTSATAPMWSGLVARLNQALGRPVGFINPVLYGRLSTGVLRDITVGTNGAYGAKAGWDACTGLGSPDGVTLLGALHAIVNATLPHAPQPSATTQPAVAAFEGAYGELVESLGSAWASASAAESADTALDEFRDRASAAYGAYVRAVQGGWRGLDPATVAPPDLYAIGRSLILSAGQIADVARLMPGAR
jgi:hypothetical protein